MKTLLTFTICLAIATPTFCQSKSALTDKQAKEYQLRIALEQIRVAIDHYHGMANRGKFQVPVGSRNYPVHLETLVNGVVDPHGKTITFLQKIPVDPMTGTTDWGLKSVPLPGAVPVQEGGGIFDVYTKSDGTALDGTKYHDWRVAMALGHFECNRDFSTVRASDWSSRPPQRLPPGI